MAKKASKLSKELTNFVNVFGKRPAKVGGLSNKEKQVLIDARQKHSTQELADSIGIHPTSLNRYIRKENITLDAKTTASREWTMSVKGNNQIFINGQRVVKESAIKQFLDVIL